MGGKFLTPNEVIAFVIKRWMLDHTPDAIMMALVCQGINLKKKEILVIIKRFIELNTENQTYGKGKTR